MAAKACDADSRNLASEWSRPARKRATLVQAPEPPAAHAQGVRPSYCMTSLPLGLKDGDKFALIAVENCATKLVSGLTLPEGTVVLTELPSVLDDQLKTWLGDLVTQRLCRCNLALLRSKASSEPKVLDHEHQELGNHVTSIFWLLQLSGVLQFDGAFILKGSAHDGRFFVRQCAEAKQFYRSDGARSERVNEGRLVKAANMKDVWLDILAAGSNFSRFRKGLNILLEALQERFGQERLHGYVRALEALILPATGKTRKQFIDRRQSFAVRKRETATVLADAFDMRSDVEHLHPWDRSLAKYPPARKEAVALRRTRQLERVATAAYRRILTDDELRRCFADDGTISQFWKLGAAERLSRWGGQIDIAAVR